MTTQVTNIAQLYVVANRIGAETNIQFGTSFPEISIQEIVAKIMKVIPNSPKCHIVNAARRVNPLEFRFRFFFSKKYNGKSGEPFGSKTTQDSVNILSIAQIDLNIARSSFETYFDVTNDLISGV